jgi:ABC-type lipoprotein export system ATPase subunit
MIELAGIGKIFERKGVERVVALSDVSLRLERGELLAIVGSSGSG